MTCQDAARHLSLYLYSELTFEQEEQLEQHLDGCGDCRSELERERALQRAMDVSAAEPSPELLAACRREFDRRIVAETQQPAFWARVRNGIASLAPYRAAWRPLGALALVAVGFFGARLWDATSSTAEPSLVRVRSLSPGPRGDLQLGLEEVRRKMVTGSLDDQRIRQMLIAAAADPADPGLRVQTVEVLSELAKAPGDSSDVRRALLRAVAEDDNAGVRLKAIEGLRQFGGDPETRRVLAGVVLADENPGVRTHAIDMLVERPQADSIGTFQELMMRESNPYIRHKTRDALRLMNASAETF